MHDHETGRPEVSGRPGTAWDGEDKISDSVGRPRRDGLPVGRPTVGTAALRQTVPPPLGGGRCVSAVPEARSEVRTVCLGFGAMDGFNSLFDLDDDEAWPEARTRWQR